MIYKRIAKFCCIVNRKAIVLLILDRKYYGIKLLYQHLT